MGGSVGAKESDGMRFFPLVQNIIGNVSDMT